MVNITHSQYRPMLYVSVKGDVIEVNPYATQLIHEVQCVWWSDISCSVYLWAAFMTIFALHPEAIIQGWLL